MDRAGIHEGTIFRYHQARRNTKKLSGGSGNTAV